MKYTPRWAVCAFCLFQIECTEPNLAQVREQKLLELFLPLKEQVAKELFKLLSGDSEVTAKRKKKKKASVGASASSGAYHC